jgi:hypothetical protein
MSIREVICKAMVDSVNLWKNMLSLDFLHQLGLTRDDLREVPGIQEAGTAKSGTGLKVLGELNTHIHLRFGGCAKLKDKEKAKTAFATPWGSYQFVRMPLGLAGGPSS